MSSTGCRYFDEGLCRSCALLAQAPELRDSEKARRFSERVARELASPPPIAPVWRPGRVFPSRTKAKLSVSGTLENPVIGLLDAELSGTELLDCPLHLPELNAVLHSVREAIPRHGLIPYDIGTRRGELKGLILKSSETGQEILLRFVLRSKQLLENVRAAALEIRKSHPAVQVASVNLQPIPHAIVEGPEEILLTEKEVIWERFDGFELAFAPQSFSQVTHETARALYSHLRSRLQAKPARGLLDLYCGVGGFSFAAAPHVEWSLGVEISAQAIRCAGMARERNAAPHARFETGDAETYLRSYSGPAPEVVLVNPPRRGISAGLIEEIARLAPSRIFYSSCNPVTLMRDLKLLAARGYATASLHPFDMFPLTEHLEVVAELNSCS